MKNENHVILTRYMFNIIYLMITFKKTPSSSIFYQVILIIFFKFAIEFQEGDQIKL